MCTFTAVIMMQVYVMYMRDCAKEMSRYKSREYRVRRDRAIHTNCYTDRLGVQ